MQFHWHGQLEYSAGQDLQQKTWEIVQSKALQGYCIGCEHTAVITLGKRATSSEVVMSELELKKSNIAQFETDRGGWATLHSPGQLVVYPIFRIKDWDLTVREYVEMLLETTQAWLRGMKIPIGERAETGVFTDLGKIASVGIRVDRGVTRHGISINVQNNLELFDSIRVCGHNKEKMDSLQNRGIKMTAEEAFQSWQKEFSSRLAMKKV